MNTEGRKYLSFDTWWGGLNNIRMSYELAGALSVLTKRCLILPPKVYCLFLSEHQNKKTFFDFWKLFDKTAFTAQFKCIDYVELQSYKKYESSEQYFDNICADIKCYPLTREHLNWGPNLDVVHYKFTNEELNVQDQFIHFPRNLFGHWYACIQFTSATQKAKVRKKIRQGLQIKSEFKRDYFNGEPYNAIHVRSGDFNVTRKESTLTLFSNLRQAVGEKVSKDKPLYIATDEKDRDKFKCLNGYSCYYLSDFEQADLVT